jgi:hypothetical protein
MGRGIAIDCLFGLDKLRAPLGVSLLTEEK